jgi:hypothetical protein
MGNLFCIEPARFFEALSRYWRVDANASACPERSNSNAASSFSPRITSACLIALVKVIVEE